MERPILVMMTGLPGSGKSTVTNALRNQLAICDFATVASDRVRKELFPNPEYSRAESAAAHQEVRDRIVNLIREGRNVIHDATNLRQADRMWRHELERMTGCWTLLVHVVLDEAETMRRIGERVARQNSISDADQRVYFTLKDSAEPILQPHLTVRTDANFNADMASLKQRIDLMLSPHLPPIHRKVFAYITHQSRLQLFTHEDAPEAGVQVPAGSVESGETLEAAVLREAYEETGLEGLTLVSSLGEQLRDMRDFGRNERHHRTFFHLRYDGQPVEMRQHDELHGSDGNRHRFNLFWSPLETLPYLIADHGFFVEKLRQENQATKQ